MVLYIMAILHRLIRTHSVQVTKHYNVDTIDYLNLTRTKSGIVFNYFILDVFYQLSRRKLKLIYYHKGAIRVNYI